MDVMFGAELPHMGSMGHATSAFMDPGLEYTLGYSQVQLAIKPEIVHVTAIHRARCSINLANPYITAVHVEHPSSTTCATGGEPGSLQVVVLIPLRRSLHIPACSKPAQFCRSSGRAPKSSSLWASRVYVPSAVIDSCQA